MRVKHWTPCGVWLFPRHKTFRCLDRSSFVDARFKNIMGTVKFTMQLWWEWRLRILLPLFILIWTTKETWNKINNNNNNKKKTCIEIPIYSPAWSFQLGWGELLNTTEPILGSRGFLFFFLSIISSLLFSRLPSCIRVQAKEERKNPLTLRVQRSMNDGS